MITSIDKALQDFIISFLAILGFAGVDLTRWKDVILVLGIAGGKSFITWLTPNKK